MRNTLPRGERITLRSLAELDALVGEVIMQEAPEVHWEDSHAHFRFESLDEALDMFHDPVLQSFIPKEQRAITVLEEVREFRPYSTAVMAAWEVVERLSPEPLHLRKDGEKWGAAFGTCREVVGDTAAIAISLAALRARGHEVHLSVTDSIRTR